MRLLVVPLVLSLVLAGCLGASDDLVPDADPDPFALWDDFIGRSAAGQNVTAPVIQDPGQDVPRVVVAILDTGVNPFHEFFQRPETLLPGTGPVQALDAVSGNASLYVPIRPIEDREKEGTWLDSFIAPRTLYRFAGTPLYYYSMLDEPGTTDQGGHGTATSASVLTQAPDAAIVMVQTDGRNLTGALEWATAQPWIDIVSVSWGCAANCAMFYPFNVADGHTQYVETSRATWASGKLLVNSAGNDPTVQLTDDNDGPPWVIAAGGADPYRKGEAWIASKAPDVLSDYTVLAPVHHDVKTMRAASGTSFAAPSVAGTLAAALLEARVATRHHGGIIEGALVQTDDVRLTNSDLRHALNQSAVYWTTTDYDATATHPAAMPFGVLSAGVPINPVAPWLQMGWGYTDASVVPTMLTGLLDGTHPTKDPNAVAHMQARQDAREALWT